MCWHWRLLPSMLNNSPFIWKGFLNKNYLTMNTNYICNSGKSLLSVNPSIPSSPVILSSTYHKVDTDTDCEYVTCQNQYTQKGYEWNCKKKKQNPSFSSSVCVNSKDNRTKNWSVSPLILAKACIEGARELRYKPRNEKWDTLRPQELCRVSQMLDTVPGYKCAILGKCSCWSHELWAADFGRKFVFSDKVTLMKNWMKGWCAGFWFRSRCMSNVLILF